MTELSFSFASYGEFIPGLENLTATGTDQSTALPLTAQISHFSSVPIGSGCVLPMAEASSVLQLTVLNRGGGFLLVYPAPNGVIENGAVNAPISIPDGSMAMFWTFDPVTSPGRQWFALTLS